MLAAVFGFACSAYWQMQSLAYTKHVCSSLQSYQKYMDAWSQRKRIFKNIWCVRTYFPEGLIQKQDPKDALISRAAVQTLCVHI